MNGYYKVKFYGTDAAYEAEITRLSGRCETCLCLISAVCGGANDPDKCCDILRTYTEHVPINRWRAEYDEWYWSVDDSGKAHRTLDFYMERDDELHASGNYYQTEEEAEHTAKVVSAAYAAAHGEDAL